jgi:two-component system sensor histidine kinase BarA
MNDAAESLSRIEIVGVDGDPLRLEELVDKNALRELLASSERVFGVPIRVVSQSGTIVSGSAPPRPAQPLEEADASAIRVADEALHLELSLSGGARTHAYATGELCRVVPLEYDRTPVGRILLGPFVPARVDPARIEEVGAHLATTLEVMLFSGHKALLTSQMHLATMRESYRELCDKNERLEEAYERLKELDRLKSNFLATVSHELRTPLTSIMGYGEMLAEGVAGALNEEQREFVETIRSKSDQLLGLIMSLLDLSKLESGTMPVRVGRLSIAAVIEEAISTLAPSALKKGVGIDVEIPPDLPPVLGDSDRLRQVFINLTDNAVKFTPAAGRVRIVARMTVEQNLGEPGLVLVAPLRPVVEVRVIDTGIGIAASERDKVFDPFYQIDQSSTREYGGAGLGLAIVRRLVEAHQGTIHVEGNEPEGAVFVVILPAARTSVMPPRGSMPPPSRGPASGRGSLPPIFG